MTIQKGKSRKIDNITIFKTDMNDFRQKILLLLESYELDFLHHSLIVEWSSCRGKRVNERHIDMNVMFMGVSIVKFGSSNAKDIYFMLHNASMIIKNYIDKYYWTLYE